MTARDAPLRVSTRRRVAQGLVLLIPALLFAAVVGRDLARPPGLGDAGVRATATVLAVDADGRGATVRYPTPAGPVTAQLRPAPGALRDKQLPVEYDAGNPRRAVVVTGQDAVGAVLALVVAGFTALFGLALVRGGLRHAQRARAALATPGRAMQLRLVERHALLRAADATGTEPAVLAVPLLRPFHLRGLERPHEPGTAQVHGDLEPGGLVVPVLDGVTLWPAGKAQEARPVELTGFPRPGAEAWRP